MFESVGARLRRLAAATPDAALFACDGVWRSFAEVDRTADEIAGGLAALGVARGDRVALLCGNRPELLEMFFGSARLGTVHVALNSFLKGEFLRYQLADSGATVLVVDSSGYAAAAPVLAGTQVQHVIVLDSIPGLSEVGSASVRTISELRSRSSDYPVPELGPADLLSLCYTSGTTGRSKGCMLSHGYLSRSAVQNYYELGWISENERLFTSLPLFHLAAVTCMLKALYIDGVSVAFESQFSASTFMAKAAACGAAVTWGMGPMGEAVLAQPAASTPIDLGIRMSVWIGLHPNSGKEFENRFGVTAMWGGYGQTECQPIALRAFGTDSSDGVGSPSPKFELRLVDAADHEVAPGEPGEIVVRGRSPWSMFSGYWNNPEATVAAMRNLWYHTGDLGRLLPSGELVFVDRLKDSLRRRGENVSSFELEAAIAELPSVDRVAVCAVASPLGEDDIKACIVLTDGAAPSPAELFDHFKRSLPYFAIPRYVQFRESLPLTAATGRVQKHVLRDEGITPDTIDLDGLGFAVSRDERR